MSNVAGFHNEFELQSAYEELMDQDDELSEILNDLDSRIDDLSIPESCGGSGGSSYATQTRNDLVKRYNEVLGDLRSVRRQQAKISEQLDELVD